MRAILTVALVVGAGVLIEIAVPGRTVYHAGWYNVALAALVVIEIAAARTSFRSARSAPLRWAVLALAFGTAITGLAGVASGLFAPDNRTVIGAPGQRLSLGEAAGTLVFPLVSNQTQAGTHAALEMASGKSLDVGPRDRDIGQFILRTIPRDVVYAQARDRTGARLTITQPTGTAFLSPVLLMQQTQRITARMDVPYDSFAVPAAHRIVKAVLFTPQEASMLHGVPAGEPAVLFAVDDEEDRPLPHAIALAASGDAVRAGGLFLRGDVLSYPAVEVIAAPSLAAVVLGVLLALAGAIASFAAQARTPSYS